MKTEPIQISFLEYLISGDDCLDETLGEVVFPRGFEVRNLGDLRVEFEKLANRYGLTLPAKLKKGNLVLEWKPLPGEIMNNPMPQLKGKPLRQQALKLTSEEVTAFSNVFSSVQEN
tara:strand:- start:310 stop:657 length:348 start_codon:yes stop_codon:yes gene_type:complete